MIINYRSLKVIAVPLVLALCQCKSKENASSMQKRPNVIFIMSDDHTSQAVSAYGGMLASVCPTPNIDRIANEGMLFKNCFVTNSICTPSRSAIFTGKYAHKNGVYKFTALDQRQPTLPKAMQTAGYQTAFVGKYHLHSNPVGLDYYSVLPGQGRYHNPEFIEMGDTHESGWIAQGKRTEYKGHSTDVIADKTLDYLKNKRDPNKPFMLFLHFKAPHDTWEYAQHYEDFLADVEIPEPDNLFDTYEGRSDALRTQLQYIGSDWGNHTNFLKETAHLEGDAKRKMQYQLYMKKYLRCVKGVDDNMGRILDYLDESGLTENTIIMYTGDQGFYLGEHNLYDKRFMYEEGLRMPFLVRWPGQIERGSVSDGMILNVDFASTILEVAGQPELPGTQGKSFLSLLKGSIPSDWRNSMYYRYYYSHFETEPHIGVRTYDHKLIHYNRIDQWELYDLKADRSEMNNIYSDPDYKNVVKDLKEEMYRLQKELGDDPADDGSKPNIGELSGNPLYKTTNVDFGRGDISILTRFRSNVGGTLYSKCRLGDVPYSDKFEGKGMKTMFFRKGDLIFNDGYDDDSKLTIASNLLDNQWHSIAVVIRDKYPHFYVDGEFIMKGMEVISDDNPTHTFNIGAGVDFSGYNGYNFNGIISETLIYDTSLNEEAVMAHAEGMTPDGNKIVEWKN